MRFYTLEENGAAIPAISFDGGSTIFSLQELGFPCADIAQLIRESSADTMVALQSIEKTGCNATPMDWSRVKLLAPIMHPDQDMICLGINYDEHAAEATRFSEDAFGGERPYTIYFSKRVNRASGSGEAIPAYENLVDGLDYEVELGVILGKDAKAVCVADAESYIFGYTIINDVSARNLQTRHKQWYLGKSLDGFTPMGPCIVTPEEMGDPANAVIQCFVNGELRQNSNTKFMMQSVAAAIAELSAGMTLKAGTIIATGTPAGVGMGFHPPKFLKRGDTVTCHIQGIGELTNPVE